MFAMGNTHPVNPQGRNPPLVFQGPVARDVHSWWVCLVVLRLEQRMDAPAYVAFAIGIVLAQGFLLPDRIQIAFDDRRLVAHASKIDRVAAPPAVRAAGRQQPDHPMLTDHVVPVPTATGVSACSGLL